MVLSRRLTSSKVSKQLKFQQETLHRPNITLKQIKSTRFLRVWSRTNHNKIDQSKLTRKKRKGKDSIKAKFIHSLQVIKTNLSYEKIKMTSHQGNTTTKFNFL